MFDSISKLIQIHDRRRDKHTITIELREEYHALFAPIALKRVNLRPAVRVPR